MSQGTSKPTKTLVITGRDLEITCEIINEEDLIRCEIKKITVGKFVISSIIVTSLFWALEASDIVARLIEIIS